MVRDMAKEWGSLKQCNLVRENMAKAGVGVAKHYQKEP